ncbi:MAG: radical SAM protein [Candidatus Omnitrophica bacterium]|nr:radical SAM protein [Candidatus Omnitrophota bacterium]
MSDFTRDIKGTSGKRPDSMVFWQLNNLCNFRCEYCFCGEEKLSKEHPDCGKYGPAHIAGCFNDTGKVWQVHMSGGEPFLYPKFVDLCAELTKGHFISLNTNLSTLNVREFANRISPDKVVFLNAGFHKTAREKNPAGIDHFIEKVLILQEKGFNIDVGYLTYPRLLEKMALDVKYLKSRGIKLVNAKTFRGYHNGKKYPAAFTREEKEFIYKYSLDPREEKVMNTSVNYFGNPCRTGMDYFRMDPSGNLYRCSSSYKRYGNLLKGKYTPDKTPAPCPLIDCTCPYEGFKYVSAGEASVIRVAGEVLNEICGFPNRGVSLRKVGRYVRKRF